jgi:hypothetical protein
MTGREPIRSYQRIFRPERRLHQIDGRALPIPGGVQLRWLGYAGSTLLSVVALSSGSAAIDLGVAAAAAVAGRRVGGGRGALIAGSAALGGTWVGGIALGLLDWPLRLLIVPAAVATVAMQATPDGRRADRFAASWLALRLGPGRRSLERGLPADGAPTLAGSSLWVDGDERGPELRRARVRGSGVLVFDEAVDVRRGRLRQRRLLIRPASGGPRRRDLRATRVTVSSAEVVEVRP